MTQAEAASGNDIGLVGSFRGRATGTPVIGTADFFVELDLDGNVKAWRYGSLIATVPVAANSGTLTAGFACTGFSTSSLVTVSVFFNGQSLDINPGNPNSVTQTFNWQNSNSNHIGLSCRASDSVELDYLAVRKLPAHNALFTQRAFALGLSGTNAAPDADADADGESNFNEWAKGSDLKVAGPPVKLIDLITASKSLFTFKQRRLVNAGSHGVQYPVYRSTDLSTWMSLVPIELSATPISGNTGYEDVTMQVDPGITTGQEKLFIRGTISR